MRRQSGRLAKLLAVLLFAHHVPYSVARTVPSSNILFRDVAAETGLTFHHFTGATGQFYLPEIMGGGGALFDYDGDGDLDAFLVQGTFVGENRQMSDAKFPPSPGWKPGHRLFRNELIPSKKLRFTDATDEAGLNRISHCMGVAIGDYDNDGDSDLYVTNFGPNFLYRNNGNGTFTDVTREANVDDPRWSTSAAFLDFDRDGRLDLFIANYIDFTLKGNKRCDTPTGEPDYCAPNVYRPIPSRLFRNEGDGRFVDVSQSSGIEAAFGPALGVTCADFNNDGFVDIYVANDGAANLFWINKGNGTFEEGGLLAGAAYSADGAPRAGMGVTAGDFDNDGDDDILVTNLTKEGSTLYRNNGRGSFDDATLQFNLSQPSFLSTGFGTGWFDYDNDGWLDLFAANGAVTLQPSQRGESYPYKQRNQLFHSEGQSKAFRETTADAGPSLRRSEVSRGAAFGDVDILVTNNNGPARLLLNEIGAHTHWLQVRLEGAKGNRNGIGAKVAVIRKNLKPLWRRVHADGSYLSASDARAHFG
ncbi:MAG: CRTAC1 family protein, partial [Pyrinomonadaceae bacterium]|nr:CRTAC1 family protein [Pyrinomonadaceae bacterium]